MGAGGYLMRRRCPGLADGDPDGPAVATLHTVAMRTAALVRSIGIGYVLVQLVIWRGFFAAQPARLAGPALAVGSAAVVVITLARGQFRGRGGARRRRVPAEPAFGAPRRSGAGGSGGSPPGKQSGGSSPRNGEPAEGASPPATLVILDSGVCVLLAVGAGWCVPPAMRGDTASWLYVALAVQLIVPAWFAPGWLAGLLSLASAAGFWAGVQLTGAAGGTSPVAAAAFLLSVTVAVWWGYQVLYRRAARADAALAAADQESRDQYVLLSRSAERREHERLLHDTVLNTLTALARPGDTPATEVVGRCWHDVTLVQHVLGPAGGPAEGGRPPLDGLSIGLAAVVSEMRSRGLVVHVGPVPGTAAGLPVPVSAALAQAVREALANVLSHAGTGEAWVDIDTAPKGCAADPGRPGGLRVMVRDAGPGFDPAQVDPSRLGLRRSIIERIADCGGQAMVRSAQGQGTVVSLCWPC